MSYKIEFSKETYKELTNHLNGAGIGSDSFSVWMLRSDKGTIDFMALGENSGVLWHSNLPWVKDDDDLEPELFPIGMAAGIKIQDSITFELSDSHVHISSGRVNIKGAIPPAAYSYKYWPDLEENEDAKLVDLPYPGWVGEVAEVVVPLKPKDVKVFRLWVQGGSLKVAYNDFSMGGVVSVSPKDIDDFEKITLHYSFLDLLGELGSSDEAVLYKNAGVIWASSPEKVIWMNMSSDSGAATDALIEAMVEEFKGEGDPLILDSEEFKSIVTEVHNALRVSATGELPVQIKTVPRYEILQVTAATGSIDAASAMDLPGVSDSREFSTVSSLLRQALSGVKGEISIDVIGDSALKITGEADLDSDAEVIFLVPQAS